MKWLLLMLALLATAPVAFAYEHLPSEELGDMARGRQRLEALRTEGAQEAYPALMARAEQDLTCWIAGIDDVNDGKARECRDDFLANLTRMEQLAALAHGPLVAEH